MVVGVVFDIFILASLLFGILWTGLGMDIQGASDVRSYMVAASEISMTVIESQLAEL